MSACGLLPDAGALRAALVDRIEALEALSVSEEFGVHRVFAGLYVPVNRLLLAWYDEAPDPAFSYLVLIRFYDLYVERVARPALSGVATDAPHWRFYFELDRGQVVTRTVTEAVRLMVRGARAHIRHDLGEAILTAVADYRRLFGRAPDLALAHRVLFDRRTSSAFFRAALVLNAYHRRRERGWRRFELCVHVPLAWLLRPFWVGTVQSWRRAAWHDAMHALAASEPAPAAARQAPSPARLFRTPA